MKNETSLQNLVLESAFRLHSEILGDESFCGYEGTKEQFDDLYDELYVIARDEVSLEVDPVNQIIDVWCTYQNEVCVGDRDPQWYL
jgi:hypothetical protein